MAMEQPDLTKRTLDKDLDKITNVEAATHYIARQFANYATATLFLIVAGFFAGASVSDTPEVWIIVAAAAIGAYMAVNIGANDVTNNVGPAVGAKAISMTAALVMAAICEIAGALLAGGKVVQTISNGIIDASAITDSDVLVWTMMSALLAAALWINLATWLKAPISTTHAIVGGVAGAGIAASGLSAVDWFSMAGIAAGWMISPLLAGAVAIGFLAFIKEFIIYRTEKVAAARFWVPILSAIMAGVFATYLAFIGLQQILYVSLYGALLVGLGCAVLTWLVSAPLVKRQSIGLENRNQSLRQLFQIPLIFSAALLSFSHGANDVSNAVGPLAAIVQTVRSHSVSADVNVPMWVMLIGALGLSCGILLFGPRLIRLVGEQITKLNPMRAFCVSLATALTVLLASWFGMPVSTTHTAVGAVFGVGFFREWYTRNSARRKMAVRAQPARAPSTNVFETDTVELRRRYLVRRSHFMTIIAAWMITVPASAALAAGLYWVMFRLFM
ncbi:inorganic phosphate transporter [Agrobacterium sp.]|uniref:inorganic phosphate transporter n=1 Tax=Agrobacterium sp. TaxID=361 RepID=UPI0028B0C629|nr:inorganic phosphate transporter [Agrobacterium sp.]